MKPQGIRRGRAIAALVVGTLAAAVGITAALSDRNHRASAPNAASLSNAQLAGERLVAGFAGPTLPTGLRRMIHRGQLAGVVLFADNFSGRAGARRLARRLQSIRRPPGLRDPLLIMVDQEGGLVKRLPGAPTASAAEMGQRGPSFSRRQGALTAGNLARAGVNVNLAPVLDVGRSGGAIRDERRSFGASAAKVSGAAVPFAGAAQARGVAATAKHFPGLGAVAGNTDVGVERVDLPLQTLRDVDEAPFGDYVAAGGKLVMLSTAIYPAFSERPAVFTRAIATGELRDRLGFNGVSISDDLQSSAAKSFGGSAQVGRAAAMAGTDLLLFRSYRAAAQAGAALRAGLRTGVLPRKEFVSSAQRVLDLRAGVSN